MTRRTGGLSLFYFREEREKPAEKRDSIAQQDVADGDGGRSDRRGKSNADGAGDSGQQKLKQQRECRRQADQVALQQGRDEVAFEEKDDGKDDQREQSGHR